MLHSAKYTVVYLVGEHGTQVSRLEKRVKSNGKYLKSHNIVATRSMKGVITTTKPDVVRGEPVLCYDGIQRLQKRSASLLVNKVLHTVQLLIVHSHDSCIVSEARFIFLRHIWTPHVNEITLRNKFISI